jgi:ubiquinone/menaquinone biosynthesis C-methylase UbiE
MSDVSKQVQSTYPINQSPEEMRRLTIQAEVLHNQPTRWLFEQAGLASSMRVLDIGCGAGDVSLLAAEFVGPKGAVVGLDSSREALATARARAAHHGLTNVTFVAGDLSKKIDLDTLAIGGPFDALVGRSVLMYLPDPAATLRGFLPLIRPGGVVAFREVLAGEPFLEAVPACQLIDEFNAWYQEHGLMALSAVGMTGQTGLRLHQVFQDAGLAPPHVWLHAPIGHTPEWFGWEYLTHQVQMITALARKAGVRVPADLEPATFGHRVREQILAQRGLLRIQRGVQASIRLPGIGP